MCIALLVIVAAFVAIFQCCRRLIVGMSMRIPLIKVYRQNTISWCNPQEGSSNWNNAARRRLCDQVGTSSWKFYYRIRLAFLNPATQR